MNIINQTKSYSVKRFLFSKATPTQNRFSLCGLKGYRCCFAALSTSHIEIPPFIIKIPPGFIFSEAIIALDRAIPIWLKGNFALISTIRTNSLMPLFIHKTT